MEDGDVRSQPPLVYVDETGCNIWTSMTRGRATIGSPAIRKVDGQPFNVQSHNCPQLNNVTQIKMLPSSELQAY